MKLSPHRPAVQVLPTDRLFEVGEQPTAVRVGVPGETFLAVAGWLQRGGKLALPHGTDRVPQAG